LLRGGELFTGLVEGIGKIGWLRATGKDVVLGIEPPFPPDECREGDSVAVNGVCLTVTGLNAECFTVDVSQETLSISTIGSLKTGDSVNLERALRLSDRLGGHIVLGHVDGIGKIERMTPIGKSWRVRVVIDSALSGYIIEKGSIAVDGVSLTVNLCGARFFEVNIIPQTGRETVLLRKRPGDSVNIETDMIGKYVEKFIGSSGKTAEGQPGRIDRDFLQRHGYGE